MTRRYDEEIRAVESRIARERQALIDGAEDLGETARDAAVSPKGLLTAFAIGFLLGGLSAPRRREKPPALAATTRKVGLGGLLGSALIGYVQSQYGSPWALGHRAWSYYAAAQRARREVMERQARTAARTAPMSQSTPVATPMPGAAHGSAPATASSAYPQPLRAPKSHAAG